MRKTNRSYLKLWMDVSWSLCAEGWLRRFSVFNFTMALGTGYRKGSNLDSTENIDSGVNFSSVTCISFELNRLNYLDHQWTILKA
jgi:hypothetical protein